jgi:hypothetical protein
VTRFSTARSQSPLGNADVAKLCFAAPPLT